jgi:acetate kinase
MRVLVLNAGSSTLKASVLDGDNRDPLFATTLEWGADASRAEGRAADFEALLEHLVVEGIPVGSIEAIGHRVVHGGTQFTAPTLVDNEVLDELDGLAELAPLHNPVAVETIRAALVALPGVPEAAAFDTAFHATLPPAAFLYPLPDAWVTAHGLRRFGFHGLSVEWATARSAELLGAPAVDLGLVVAHLGSGCSVTAVDGGRSAWTSMGMTPLEGLMMGTRSGSVDPGILVRLLHAGVTPDELDEGLEHESGLLGVAGSADMRELLDRVGAGDSDAELAVELFARSAAQGIAAAATALPRLDGLVFTGGIGEHAGPVRARIVGRLGVLGLFGQLADAETDAVLTARGAGPAVLRVEAREDLVIAEATRRLLD